MSFRGPVRKSPFSLVSFPKYPSGFTLVELLVVMGVIAIASVIFFAASGRVAEMSTKTRCLSNLRQIGAAFHAYAADNQHQLPASNPKDVVGTKWTGDWFNPRENGVEYSPAAYAGGLKAWQKLTLCPKNITPEGSFQYCTNYNLMVPSSVKKAVSLLTLNRPNEIVMLADSSATRGIWGAGLWGPSSGWARLENRHAGVANILWASGHVSSVNKTSLTEVNFK